MPKPAAYLRVSSADQRERESILSQEYMLRQYFERQGLDPDTDVLWYRDDGVSGKMSMISRGDGAKLLQDVQAGVVRDYVAVFSISRLSRDAPDYFTFVQMLEESGVSIRSVSQGIDTQQDGGEFIAGIMALIAAKNHEDLMLASKAGHERAARAGRWQGEPPYGYRVGEGARLEVIPEQAEVVREIFRLYVEERMGGGVISRHLAERGIPGPRGGKWYDNTVLRILRNTAYVGRALYNLTKTIRRKGKFQGYQPRDASEHIEVPAPPIIEADLFDRAQTILARRSNQYAKTGYAASHFILPHTYCGLCKARFWAETSVPRRETFKRHRYYRHDARSGRRGCPGCALVPAGALEKLVWSRVLVAIRDPNLWQEEMRAELEREPPEQDRELATIESKLGELRIASNRLDDAYIMRGLLTLERYEELATELREKRERLTRRQAELRRQADLSQHRDERRREMAHFMRQLQAQVEEATTEEQRAIVGALIACVWIVSQNNKLEITIEWNG